MGEIPGLIGEIIMNSLRFFTVMRISNSGMGLYALTLVGRGKRFGKVFDLAPRYVRIYSSREKLLIRAEELNEKILERLKE